MEVITIIGLLMTCVLVFEKIWVYTVSHLKKSKCCGGEIEFDNLNASQKNLYK
jgi:hypothetical protein